METAIPHLRILDYEKAVAFYVGALGFEIDFEWRNAPDLPVYMGIRRGTHDPFDNAILVTSPASD